MSIIKANAKALVLLALIVIAGVAQALEIVDIGLDVEHYIALLVADGIVWGTPNTEPPKGDPEAG